jgi:hypothetical protein
MLELVLLLAAFLAYIFYQYRILGRIYGSFRIQLTVGCGNQFKFKDHCEGLGLEPMIIEGEERREFVASRCLHGTDEDAKTETVRLCDLIKTKGMQVERVKINAPISNLGIPDEDEARYFEIHVKVKVQPNDEPKLKGLLASTGAHLVANTLNGETGKRFVTLQSRSRADAVLQLETQLLPQLKGYQVISTEHEFCVLDSNTNDE